MRRVSPSVIAREQLRQLLVGGADRESNIVSALVETVTRQVVQELLEGEQQDFLGGRGRYHRRGEGQAGSRNGYERGRLRTAEGFIDVAVPQVRGTADPFRFSLMGFSGRQQRGVGVVGQRDVCPRPVHPRRRGRLPGRHR